MQWQELPDSDWTADKNVLRWRPAAAAMSVVFTVGAVVGGLSVVILVYRMVYGQPGAASFIGVGLFAAMTVVLGRAGWALGAYALAGKRRAFLNATAARLVVVVAVALCFERFVATGSLDALALLVAGGGVVIPIALHLWPR